MALKLSYVLLAFTVPFASALWPMPRGLTSGTTPVKLSGSFNVHLNIHHAPNDLQDAVQRVKSHLKTDTFERLVVGRGKTDADAVKKAHVIKTLTMSLTKGAAVRSIATEVNTVGIDGRDESYSLVIPTDSSEATLTANSTLGLFRGITSFDVMWYRYQKDKYILNGPLTITDSPAFVRIFFLR